MKKIATVGFILIFLGLIFIKFEDIKTIFINLLDRNHFVSIKKVNNYYRDNNYEFVQITDNFSPNNSHDIDNIYYTFINSGLSSFTFYCPSSYPSCLEDIQALANDQEKLSDINNYVHPFNGFSHIETVFDSLGKVTITTIKSYSDEQIEKINKRIDELYPTLVSDEKSVEDNIRSVHDYIIKNTKYDSMRSDFNQVNYHSDIAYGPLFEGYGLCGGYTDLMALFLDRMGVMNYKISSNNHVWNAVKINGVWYHLDLTWDDPVSSDGSEYLEYTYFLIDTNSLIDAEKTQHKFDVKYYPEFSH